MSSSKKVLAICGSTRKASSNLYLIQAIATLAKDRMEITLFEGLMNIPPFNPDDDNDQPPAVITSFRQQLRNADGILICTPEYAMGLPGTLKNAIDWTVSSCEFSNKPVAAITASSQGNLAHASLLATLKVIEAHITDDTQLLISFIKTKVNSNGEITNEETLRSVQKLVEAFGELMNREM
ncbi:MAG: NADPH-dependent FMN reductase [Chitinophagaceae bacterium]